jgi:hypothetical protein
MDRVFFVKLRERGGTSIDDLCYCDPVASYGIPSSLTTVIRG